MIFARYSNFSHVMLKCNLQDMRKIFSPPFAGIPTFAKFPLVSHKDWGEIADSFGIIGVPYDMGTTDLPGARLAPRSIRSTSTQYAYTSSEDNYGLRDSLQGFYDIETSKWILQAKPCYDLGDVEVFAVNLIESQILLKIYQIQLSHQYL